MDRHTAVAACEPYALRTLGPLYGIKEGSLRRVADYEGCSNLVYEYRADGEPRILRISYRPDRGAEMIRAELDYVEYLARHGVRVARPVSSGADRLVEEISVEGGTLPVVAFERAPGMRVPDNGYRYREDAPISEYFENWGAMLGRMHALAMDYAPPDGLAPRPDWFALHRPGRWLASRVPERLRTVRERIAALFDEIAALPRERGAYGLIHGDFMDGNFCVDYSKGNMTVFDFDDCCRFWFVFELASAWEGGIGRVMFRPLDERVAFMDRYMAHVMAGYNRWHTLSDDWLARLPLFVRLIHAWEFLYFAQYLDSPDPDMRAQHAYRVRCIEDEIPYMGFFDSIYSHERPFRL